jgi:hypothetical protein
MEPGMARDDAWLCHFAAGHQSPGLGPERRVVVNSAPMKFARTHQSLIAWMLYGFILFNGLACSISHGQMLGAFSRAVESDICGPRHTAGMKMDAKMSPGMDMSDKSSMADHALLMKLSMDNCAFAGTLALSMIFFIALGWLIRALRPRLHTAYSFRKRTPRHTFPALLPQAP